MLPGDSEEKHGTKMKDILIMHFIAESHTNGSRRFTGIVTTTGNRSEFDLAVFHFVRPRVVYKRYRFARKKAAGTVGLTVRCV